MVCWREADHTRTGVCVRATLLIFALASTLGAQTIGEANHNPGNIRSTDYRQWPGAVGVDRWHHLRFRTDLDGIKTMRRILTAYWRKYKINTVAGICGRWTRNPKTVAEKREWFDYARAVAQHAHVKMDAALNMQDRRLLEKVALGIAYAENGELIYPESLFDEAFGLKRR